MIIVYRYNDLMKYILPLALAFVFTTRLYSITKNEQKLIYAVENYEIETIRTLIEDGVSPSVKDAYGKTAIHYSIKSWTGDALEILLKSKYANVNIRDNYAMTPLHYSFKTSTSEIAFMLIERGANLNMLGIKDETYLHYAALAGFTDVAEFLVKKKKIFYANTLYVNVSTKGGKTPLHYAVYGGNIETVKFLVENGAKPDRQNLDGETPEYIAVLKGFDDIVYYLEAQKKIKGY